MEEGKAGTGTSHSDSSRRPSGSSEAPLAAQRLLGKCNLGRSPHARWGPRQGRAYVQGADGLTAAASSPAPAPCSIQAAGGRMDALLQGDPGRGGPTAFGRIPARGRELMGQRTLCSCHA